METGINVIILILMFIIAAFFVMSEFAIVQVRPTALKVKLNDSKYAKQAQQALDVKNKLNEYLSTVQVGITITGLVVGWLGESTVYHLIENLLPETLMQMHVAILVLRVFSVLLLTYLEVVLTELIPKSLAIDDATTLALKIAKPLHIVHKIVYPLVWLMNESSAKILKLFGKNLAGEGTEPITEQELLILGKDATLDGEIGEDDYLFMKRSFEFNDKVVKDIMVKDMVVLRLKDDDVELNVDDVAQFVLKHGYTRYPVSINKGNFGQNYIGYIYTKDLWGHEFKDKESIALGEIVKPILTLDSSMLIINALRLMKQERSLIALVKVEGKIVGLVTMEDILEQFVGKIDDEMDN